MTPKTKVITITNNNIISELKIQSNRNVSFKTVK